MSDVQQQYWLQYVKYQQDAYVESVRQFQLHEEQVRLAEEEARLVKEIEEHNKKAKSSLFYTLSQSRYAYLFIVMLLFVWCIIFLIRGFYGGGNKKEANTADPMVIVMEKCMNKYESTGDQSGLTNILTTLGIAEVFGNSTTSSPVRLTLYFLLFVLTIHFLQAWMNQQLDSLPVDQ